MGRMKNKKHVYKKAKAKVATSFNCPFCNHPKTVECKMDKKKMEGRVECRVCDVAFDMIINHLTDPVDIFHEWLDTIEEAKEAKDPVRQCKVI